MVHHKRTLQMKQNKMEMDLKRAEVTHKSQPIKANLVKVQTLRAALDSVTNEKPMRSLFYQKQRYRMNTETNPANTWQVCSIRDNMITASIRDEGRHRKGNTGGYSTHAQWEIPEP